ncbi:MAG: L-lactate permease [Verrucomicrobiaceae bacterium]|nr:L-lactate permease [Verrucomicrobiaceae bacterium]
MTWLQNYDPLHHPVLSTVLAAVPVVALLGMIAWGHMPVHKAAIAALLLALGVAVFGCDMPAKTAGMAALNGACYGLLPIGWMILNIIFLYKLTVDKGWFDVLKNQLVRIAPDPCSQVILIAFCFGAFFEGTAGFGSPVAVTAALLIQLGFKPLQSCGLALIANTAPVAFGAMGTPLIALNSVTGIDLLTLSKMAGRQLPFFSLLVPFWVVAAYDGWKGVRETWSIALAAGLAFAVPQFLLSNFHGPWLVDIVSSITSLAAVIVVLKIRHRALESEAAHHPARWLCWSPWIILSVVVFIWSLGPVKKRCDDLFNRTLPVPGLHNVVQRVPPVAPEGAPPEKAEFKLNLVSATGTGILAAALLSGLLMRYSIPRMARLYVECLWRLRYSLATIAAMLALGYVTKYSGCDATMGLALSKTGVLYPFFGTLLGWLGVALTGSDTSSNVIFGSLQTITANQVGISPVLMATANSTGGVMGKMIDAQSIVVASTATGWFGHEGRILRYVFIHSIVLAALVGVLVFLQAYVWPFTLMVPGR